MSKIWMPGGGGGGDGSDDCTLALADVPQGLKAITADSDDDAKDGTLDAVTSAADSHVLAGESYMKFNQDAKHWEKRQGGLKNNGAINFTLNCGESRQIPGGFTTGGTVRANSLASQTPGTASAPQILAGQTAWVNGNRVDGTMPNRGGYWGFGNNRGVDAGNQRMWVQVPGGYYDENAQVFLSWADIRNLTGLTPDKIKKGQSILGIIGSFQGYTDSPLYLYNRGTWSNLQTTGFTTTNGGPFHINSRNVYKPIEAMGGGYEKRPALARLNQMINLTSYNYLKSDMYADAHKQNEYATATTAYIGVSKNPNLQALTFDAFFAGSGNKTNFAAFNGLGIADISRLQGDYYIYMAADNPDSWCTLTAWFYTIFLSST